MWMLQLLLFDANGRKLKGTCVPLENLEITVGGVHKKYELQCIIEHRGRRVQSGHYVSYFKISDGTWYEADDEIITQKWTDQLPKQPYICIYKETAASAQIAEIPNIEITTCDKETAAPAQIPPQILKYLKYSNIEITTCDKKTATLHAIHLCTSLLFSSKIFQKFLVGNNVRTQLLQIAKTLNSRNNIDTDIANIFIGIFNDFNSKLESNLKDEMNFIFGIKKIKRITLSQNLPRRRFFKKETTMVKKTSLMKLDIMTEANKQLQTIEIFFNNALEKK